MLQRFLLITLTLCSLTATAQWQQTGSKVRYVNGLGIPTKDTAAGVSADSSQIVIRPADSSLYIKYKRTWVKVGAGGGGTIGGSGTINRVPKFTAGTTLGNSSIVDSASAVAMTINPSGKVGIGTASPGGVLDVKEAELNITSYNYGLDFKVTGAGGFSRASRYYNTNFLSSTAFFGVVGDASTGVTRSYWVIGNPATDTTGYQNTNGVHLLSSGNLGIGYTAPAAKLAVSGTALINTNTDNGVDKLQVSGSMSVGSVKASGNVGIFNSSPFYALHVGDGTSTRQIVINGLNSGSAGGSSIAVQANSLTTIMFGNKSNIIGGAYDGQPVFGFGGSTNSLQFYNFNTLVTSAMISSGDRFLIGTTSDNGVDKLQVSGSGLVTGNFVAASTSGNVSLRNTASTYAVNITTGANSGIGLYEDGTQSTIIGQNQNLTATNFLSLRGAGIDLVALGSTNATIKTNSNNRLQVLSSGRVLLGATLPTDNTVDALQVNGSISGIGMKQAYVAKTGAYTATDADYVIDCTSGTFTLTLPASSGRTGRILIIKNSGAGTITVDGNGAETIDGAATYAISVQYGTIQIMSDGTNWKTIAKF